MRIHLWIRTEKVEQVVKFLSDDFGYDEAMNFDVWYSNPIDYFGIKDSNAFIQISITPDQYAKLESL